MKTTKSIRLVLLPGFIVMLLAGCNPAKPMETIVPTNTTVPTFTPVPMATNTPTITPTFTPTSTQTPTLVPTPIYAPHLEDDLTKPENYAEITLEDVTSGRLASYIRSQITMNPFPNGKICYYGQNSDIYEHAANIIYCQPRSQAEEDEYSKNLDKRPVRILYGFSITRNNTPYLIFAQGYAHDDGSYGLLFIAWSQENKLSTRALEDNWGYLIPLWQFQPELFPDDERYRRISQALLDINFNDDIIEEICSKSIKYQTIPDELSRYILFADWVKGWNYY